jgi:cell division protein FtsB
MAPAGQARARRRVARPTASGTGATRRRVSARRLVREQPRTVVAATTKALGLSSTRRAAILALVVCAVALTVVVPLRNFVAQRQELAAVEEHQQVLAADVARLSEEKQHLQDPAATEAEARTRLQYAKPGDVPYVVQLPTAPVPEPDAPGSGAPWYRTLWREVSAGAP